MRDDSGESRVVLRFRDVAPGGQRFLNKNRNLQSKNRHRHRDRTYEQSEWGEGGGGGMV